jgi:hypothetical protein
MRGGGKTAAVPQEQDMPSGQMVHSSADCRDVEPLKVPGGQGNWFEVMVPLGQ